MLHLPLAGHVSMRMNFLPTAIAILALCTGCGRDDDSLSHAQGRFQRLDFRTPVQENASSIEKVVTLKPDGDGPDWILESTGKTSQREVEGQMSVLLEGRGERRTVRIPLRPEERDFNLIVACLLYTSPSPRD